MRMAFTRANLIYCELVPIQARFQVNNSALLCKHTTLYIRFIIY